MRSSSELSSSFWCQHVTRPRRGSVGKPPHLESCCCSSWSILPLSHQSDSIVSFLIKYPTLLPSVLWHCWLGGRKDKRPIKNGGGWWRWALVSPDGVVPSRMVSVSASVNLPLHNKVQKFSSGTGSPRLSRKRAIKQLWCGGDGFYCTHDRGNVDVRNQKPVLLKTSDRRSKHR